MLRQCATTAITAVHAASIRFAMPAMLGRLVAQLKMPRLDAYPGSTGAFDVVVASYALERIDIKALKPGAGRLNDGGGLYLKPFAWADTHSWRMDYTHQGRRRTLSLGSHPEMGFDEARALGELGPGQARPRGRPHGREAPAACAG